MYTDGPCNVARRTRLRKSNNPRINGRRRSPPSRLKSSQKGLTVLGVSKCKFTRRAVADVVLRQPATGHFTLRNRIIYRRNFTLTFRHDARVTITYRPATNVQGISWTLYAFFFFLITRRRRYVPDIYRPSNVDRSSARVCVYAWWWGPDTI